jgi:WD40 repeat protein
MNERAGDLARQHSLLDEERAKESQHLDAERKRLEAEEVFVFNPQELEQLKARFLAADKDQIEGLSLDEFISAFQAVLPDKPREDLRRLYMKIDANADDNVHWTEFINFILMEQNGVIAKQEQPMQFRLSTLVGEVQPEKLHDKYVDVVTYVEPSEGQRGLYVSGARDGKVKLWNPHTLKLIDTIDHFQQLKKQAFSNSRRRGKQEEFKSWVTHLCYLSKYNQLAVCSADRIIIFYDLKSLAPVSRIRDSGTHRHCSSAPTTVAFHDECDALMVGDTGGNIHIYKFLSPDWHICDRAGGLRCGHEVDLEPSLKLENVKLLRLMAYHSDWVTKVIYEARLNLMISSSLDGTVRLSDINKTDWTEESAKDRVFTKHQKGVYSFDYSRKHKCIASCGVEREVYVWDPYSYKLVHCLSVSGSSMLDVAFMDSRDLLIAAAQDKVVKVFDSRTFTVVQVLHNPILITCFPNALLPSRSCNQSLISSRTSGQVLVDQAASGPQFARLCGPRNAQTPRLHHLSP